ncbi:MAG: branched-chain amino acid transport system II carrier protein [Holosporales bacterium]|nr:branched-chain amino acid transport system II carrier protein [Holosporales bacterium]
MKKYKFVLTYGFALFGMFFGSGNLVFPLKIGQNTGECWVLGVLGLAITGVILPFLGIFVIKLYKGDYSSFFGGAGSLVESFLPLFALSLMASFGIMPRCITVAYGGINPLMPEFPLSMFSFTFCVITFLVCLKEQRIIDVVGKWMSPILLGALIALILFSTLYFNAPKETDTMPSVKAFYNGFIAGYQTMDLFAAFFFSTMIFSQIRKTLPPNTSDKDTIKISIKASIVASILLMLVYTGFVFLGANFANLITNVEPVFLLGTIVSHVMGEFGALFVGIIVILSCFTTAVALNNIYARYLCSLFNIEDRFKWVLLGTTGISFIISLFNFNGIANFLAPVLEVSYPSVIALTIISLFSKECHKLKTLLFYGILATVLLSKIMVT